MGADGRLATGHRRIWSRRRGGRPPKDCTSLACFSLVLSYISPPRYSRFVTPESGEVQFVARVVRAGYLIGPGGKGVVGATGGCTGWTGPIVAGICGMTNGSGLAGG